MQRFAPCLIVLLAGCASSAGKRPQPDPGTPLATGVLSRFTSYGGYPEPAEYRGCPCSIYSEWVRIDNENKQFWMPRNSFSFIEIETK